MEQGRGGGEATLVSALSCQLSFPLLSSPAASQELLALQHVSAGSGSGSEVVGRTRSRRERVPVPVWAGGGGLAMPRAG